MTDQVPEIGFSGTRYQPKNVFNIESVKERRFFSTKTFEFLIKSIIKIVYICEKMTYVQYYVLRGSSSLSRRARNGLRELLILNIV